MAYYVVRDGWVGSKTHTRNALMYVYVYVPCTRDVYVYRNGRLNVLKLHMLSLIM